MDVICPARPIQLQIEVDRSVRNEPSVVFREVRWLALQVHTQRSQSCLPNQERHEKWARRVLASVVYSSINSQVLWDQKKAIKSDLPTDEFILRATRVHRAILPSYLVTEITWHLYLLGKKGNLAKTLHHSPS